MTPLEPEVTMKINNTASFGRMRFFSFKKLALIPRLAPNCLFTMKNEMVAMATQ